MTAIVLLNGKEEDKNSFKNAIRDLGTAFINVSNWETEDEFGEFQTYSSGADEINANVCDRCDQKELLPDTLIIENYNHRLSRMIQDDFMAFEIKVDKTGVLSKGNCCFVLNVLDEDFAEKAKELVTKLSI